VIEDFIKWLNEEMALRGWNQAELARKAGVSRAAISNILSSMRTPGPDLCGAIAQAFQIAPEVVFRKAGLLPESAESQMNEDLADLVTTYNALSLEDRLTLKAFAKFLLYKKPGQGGEDKSSS